MSKKFKHAKMKLKIKRVDLIISFFFILGASLLFHFKFSPYGYNPSDDGVVLSGSKRLIEKQIPHRDFIQIRPMGSNLFWLPLVHFFKKSGIYIAGRLIFWIQMVSIAWVWCYLLNKVTLKLKLFYFFPLVFLSVMISSHNFPIMPWTTIDGLFLISIGMLLYSLRIPFLKLFGLFFLGFAPWCKQNFTIAPIIFVLMLPAKKRVRDFLALIFPSLLILLYLYLNKALPYFLNQITIRSNPLNVGVITYIKHIKSLYAIWGVYIILLIPLLWEIIFLTHKNKSSKTVLFLLKLFFIITAYLLVERYLMNPIHRAFLFFYLALFCSFFLYHQKNFLKLQVILITTAWATSISLGYNSPALFSGVLFASLTFYFFNQLKKYTKEVAKQFFLVGALFSLLLFNKYKNFRYNHIYRDLPFPNLKYNLEKIYPGFQSIKTSKNNYDYFLDLKRTYSLYKNSSSVALMPSNAGFWILAKENNPLPLDWIQNAEHPTNKLTTRIISSINAKKTFIIMVNKYEVKSIAKNRHAPLNLKNYAIVNYVQKNLKKINETEFFEIYSQLKK